MPGIHRGRRQIGVSPGGVLFEPPGERQLQTPLQFGPSRLVTGGEPRRPQVVECVHESLVHAQSLRQLDRTRRPTNRWFHVVVEHGELRAVGESHGEFVRFGTRTLEHAYGLLGVATCILGTTQEPRKARHPPQVSTDPYRVVRPTPDRVRCGLRSQSLLAAAGQIRLVGVRLECVRRLDRRSIGHEVERRSPVGASLTMRPDRRCRAGGCGRVLQDSYYVSRLDRMVNHACKVDIARFPEKPPQDSRVQVSPPSGRKCVKNGRASKLVPKGECTPPRARVPRV